ncbi:MAG TPA: DUF748 domain-containing protein, partial [Burkholderiaceae bacterium]|nr:DUF748 domain-containing protein [Burkholderiaceae bacterium]
MPLPALSRRWTIALGVVAAALLALLVAVQLALRRLPALVSDALGPRASVGTIEAGWRGVVVRDLAIAADPGRWPAAQELRAERVVVVPAWSSLWGGPWRVARLEVEGGYLSMLRTRDGRLQVVPSLAGTGRSAPRSAAAAAAGPRVRLDAIRLRGVTLELFDASVGAPGRPHRLRLADVNADVGPLALPALDERMKVDIAAVFKGVQRDGRLAVSGELTPSTRDAQLAIRAQGLDLVALQPYLMRRGEGGVERGTLDLRVDARASQQQLHAPGHLVLQGLELGSGEGLLATFGGVPRQAVLAAMSRDGRIELDFTLEGRLDDPKFSLNELFAARFAVGLAEKLG